MRLLLLFMAICWSATAVAATCELGYYPKDGTCTICPMNSACPDGESRMFCSLENPAQYTAAPGATECLNCPTTLLHPDGFNRYWDSRRDGALESCRAEWIRRTEHGKKLFSCYFTQHGYDDDTDFEYPKCMLDTMSCDAGYVTRILKNANGDYRIWLSSYPDADNFEVCRPVGIGYYSADGDLDSTACPPGTSTRTDTAASADECLPLCTGGATKFHAGAYVFNVWRDKYTSPTLKIQLPGADVCYVNLAPGGARGTLNVNYNGQTYHVIN